MFLSVLAQIKKADEEFLRDEHLRLAVMNVIVAGNREQFRDMIEAYEEEKRRVAGLTG